MRPHQIYIPKTLSEIIDHLGMMMIKSPTFTDNTGYFPYWNIDYIFHQLNEGLNLNRRKLGEELYVKLTEMSDRMRAHFEADPEDKTDDSLKGRDIIMDMEALLKQRARGSRRS